MPKVLLLATRETKSSEAEYLQEALGRHGLDVEVCDISLGAGAGTWHDEHKIRQIKTVAARVSLEIVHNDLGTVRAVIGLGGGTGGDIILRIMQSLPLELPKALISPLPFDPRFAMADNFIVMIPTVADMEGLNTMIRSVLDNAAGMISGLAKQGSGDREKVKSVGLTALGATKTAARAITEQLHGTGHEITTFHANGFGGAAFVRFAREGVFKGTIDMTVHEMTRMHLAGDHVRMPERFTAAGGLPRVVLPGGLNFLGLGPVDQIRQKHRKRPHYRHTSNFTHVKLTRKEMVTVATALAEDLNKATGDTVLVLPMGGFSHEDRPGGAIEDQELRAIAADCLEKTARAYRVVRLESHINDEATARTAVDALETHLGEGQSP